MNATSFFISQLLQSVQHLYLYCLDFPPPIYLVDTCVYVYMYTIHCHLHPIPVCTQAEYRGFVCSLFVESLDLLVASALDGNICEMGGNTE